MTLLNSRLIPEPVLSEKEFVTFDDVLIRKGKNPNLPVKR
jgi:hypothetical protein